MQKLIGLKTPVPGITNESNCPPKARGEWPLLTYLIRTSFLGSLACCVNWRKGHCRQYKIKAVIYLPFLVAIYSHTYAC